eukprot:CAMPEP_0184479458 /NCGR_PEP_ID=MMETSP0113_2-20130426/1181_1 /TAXON_ID=91329 /ORGANISM="Norrisiella sphaerica, Strain BC52" /LENGTH=168 /DNA_ID=CAMNT_0026857549 /DNA_START=94 /DNA_END=600 /DNA_ORIENTATION=-
MMGLTRQVFGALVLLCSAVVLTSYSMSPLLSHSRYKVATTIPGLSYGKTIGRSTELLARLRGGGKVKSHSTHNERHKLNAGGRRHAPSNRPDKKKERACKKQSSEHLPEKRNNYYSLKADPKTVNDRKLLKDKRDRISNEKAKQFKQSRLRSMMAQRKAGTARYLFED